MPASALGFLRVPGTLPSAPLIRCLANHPARVPAGLPRQVLLPAHGNHEQARLRRHSVALAHQAGEATGTGHGASRMTGVVGGARGSTAQPCFAQQGVTALRRLLPAPPRPLPSRSSSSSPRRQTRLTALDLMAYAAADDRPRVFLRMTGTRWGGGLWAGDECVMGTCRTRSALLGARRSVLQPRHHTHTHALAYMLRPSPTPRRARAGGGGGGGADASLRHTLQFGIGLHHAGLPDSDRELVERLYVGGKIQVGWRYRWQYRWQYRWRYKWCPCCRRRLLLPYGPLPPFSFQFTWSTC